MPKIVCNECGPMPRLEPRPANQFAALLNDDGLEDAAPPATTSAEVAREEVTCGNGEKIAADRTQKGS